MDRHVKLGGMNTPEKLFHTLLGLGDDWEITELEFDKVSGEVRLRIHELPSLLSQQRRPDDGGETAGRPGWMAMRTPFSARFEFQVS